MQYTLITKSGKIMQFYVKAVAELYQQLHGGNITFGNVPEEGAVYSYD